MHQARAWLLVVLAAGTRDPWRITACAIYASTLVLLYGASTLYHALSRTRARAVFRVLDHSAIFLLIAGTYTPFALVSLRGPWGWTLLAIVWGLAVTGVAAKAVFLCTAESDYMTGQTLVVDGGYAMR